MPIILVLGQSACYQVNDAFLGLKSHQRSQRNAVFKSNEGRNAFNAESRRKLRLLVNIYLADSNGAGIFLCDLVDYGSKHSAWAAPACPEVDKHSLFRLHNSPVKILGGYHNFTHSNAPLL